MAGWGGVLARYKIGWDGYPNLDFGDVELRKGDGEALHCWFKLGAVPVAQEEVAVFVVFIDGDDEILHLCTTFKRDSLLSLELLVGDQGGSEVAEL